MTARTTLARTMIALFVTALVALMTAPVEAKRFGGGKSFGFQGQKTTQSNTSQRQSTTDQKATSRSPVTGLGGMMAGLAAGGLLAWMFMGGAFEGFQPFDFLLIALLAVGAFLLIRHLRGGAMAAGRPALSGMPGQGNGSSAQMRASAFEQYDRTDHTGGQAPRPGSVMAEFGDFSGPSDYQPPAWFDEERFLGAARTHFTNLQLAWDANRMEDIRAFVTSAFFRELVLERASMGDIENHTEVLSLDVALEDLGEQDGDLVAAVRFTGQVREQTDAEPTGLDETWFVCRDLDTENANWLIGGIRQNT
ncbi:TIM44-like domain-containing protein [Guyparkeria sp. 1SP6A2]|nr:TIM44-like domain-containing protein [Guyparkeria sp. 1SP6A2]